MGLDEKRLDDWLKDECLCLHGELCNRCRDVLENEAELIRLARLGLWAEQYAVPALKYYDYGHSNYGGTLHGIGLTTKPEQEGCGNE